VRAVLAPTLVAALLAALTTAAGAAPAERSVRSPGTVTGLGQNRGFVAFASGAVTGDCDHVELWSTYTRGVSRFGRKRPCGEQVSTGRGIVGPAVSGQRALWLSYAGGNIREWTLLTATPTARTPRRLAFAAADVDGPAPIVIGDGADTSLPYAVGATITVLGPSGSRLARWQATAPVRMLTSGAGRVAAVLADGAVVVYSAAGVVVAEYPYAPGAVTALRLGLPGVLIQVGSAVDARKGAAARSVQLRPGARMLDFAEGIVLYAKGPDLFGRKLSTGKEALFATPGPPGRGRTLLAQLEPRGLSYAQGDRILWRAWVHVAAAFAS